MKQRWEMGSEFDWSDEYLSPDSPEHLLPGAYELFSTGTAALLSINKLSPPAPGKRRRLHMPSFYCMKIAARMQTVYEVCWYRDLPGESSPDFATLQAAPGDLVLAANIFGLRPGEPWRDWSESHPDAVLIEDHTHDPFSPWALHSSAHYGMASLRKTLPIPDGGMSWSPRGLALPSAAAPASPAASKLLTSMLLKRAYLNGAPVGKDTYRQLALESQEELFYENDSGVSAFTASVLPCLNVPEFRRQREANVRHFIQLSLADPHPAWTPLFTSWPEGAVPYNSVIVCQTGAVRDALQRHLVQNNIFPPIHWPQPKMDVSSGDARSLELAGRILTIPTDQRYSLEDVERVAGIIARFFDSGPPARSSGSGSV